MTTKLTLSLEASVIEKAKRYSSKRHLSLSKMVESYFQILVKPDQANFKVSPWVEELSGIIKPEKNKNWKKGYAKFLTRKYSR